VDWWVEVGPQCGTASSCGKGLVWFGYGVGAAWHDLNVKLVWPWCGYGMVLVWFCMAWVRFGMLRYGLPMLVAWLWYVFGMVLVWILVWCRLGIVEIRFGYGIMVWFWFWYGAGTVLGWLW
jgi:hypothetical protein